MLAHLWNEELPEFTEKDKYQNSIFFPIGQENHYGQFFVDKSYFVPVSSEQVPIFNII